MYKSILLGGICCVLLLWCGFSYHKTTKLQNQVYHYLQSLDLITKQQRSSFKNDEKTVGTPRTLFPVNTWQKLFDQGAFGQVLLKIEQGLRKDPSNLSYSVNKAIVLLKMEEFDTAFDLLQQLHQAQNKQQDYRLDAAWMKALVYLHWEDSNKAGPLLQEIIQQRGTFFKEATQLVSLIS